MAAVVSLCTTPSEWHDLPSPVSVINVVQKNTRLCLLSRQRNASIFLMLCRQKGRGAKKRTKQEEDTICESNWMVVAWNVFFFNTSRLLNCVNRYRCALILNCFINNKCGNSKRKKYFHCLIIKLVLVLSVKWNFAFWVKQNLIVSLPFLCQLDRQPSFIISSGERKKQADLQCVLEKTRKNKSIKLRSWREKFNCQVWYLSNKERNQRRTPE